MAKQDADQTPAQEIEQAINQWVEYMSEQLGLVPTEDEIANKRKELERGAGLAVPSGETVEVNSWAELEELSRNDPEQIQVIDDYVKLDDKKLLLGIPFAITRFWFSVGDVSDYATMKCVLSRPVFSPDGETDRVVITDGSRGIYEQLRKVVLTTGKTANLVVRHGLRVSTYDVDTEEGTKKASTFYLT